MRSLGIRAIDAACGCGRRASVDMSELPGVIKLLRFVADRAAWLVGRALSTCGSTGHSIARARWGADAPCRLLAFSFIGDNDSLKKYSERPGRYSPVLTDVSL
jgi:hypothetical protein